MKFVIQPRSPLLKVYTPDLGGDHSERARECNASKRRRDSRFVFCSTPQAGNHGRPPARCAATNLPVADREDREVEVHSAPSVCLFRRLSAGITRSNSASSFSDGQVMSGS